MKIGEVYTKEQIDEKLSGWNKNWWAPYHKGQRVMVYSRGEVPEVLSKIFVLVDRTGDTTLDRYKLIYE